MSQAFSLVSWNVNSVRARLDHVLTYLEDQPADIVCLQETKVEDRLFPKVPFLEMGYQVYLHGAKALAGVAILAKKPADEVQTGFASQTDRHTRILACRWGKMRIYNLYVPNGTELGSDAFKYKLQWLRDLREELDATQKEGDDLILCGDFNIAPEERDVWDVSHMQGRLHFTDEEHKALANLLEHGLADCFRKHHEEGGNYSWFDYRQNAWPLRHGLRIDHVYASPAMLKRCMDVVHDLEPRDWDSPSDHVPVRAVFSGET